VFASTLPETLFLTRRDKSKADSYMISIPQGRQGFVSNCNDWTAPKLPVFPIGDVNPPCWTFNNGETSTLANRNLRDNTVRRANSVTFSEVQLVDLATPLWLPVDMKVHVTFKEHGSENGVIPELSYRNEHHYSDYRHYGVSVKMVAPQ
jgi:hypothetical protein